MKKLVAIFLFLPRLVFSSFPAFNSIVVNSEPSTDSWIPLIISFWLLVIIIPILIIRFIRKRILKNKTID